MPRATKLAARHPLGVALAFLVTCVLGGHTSLAAAQSASAPPSTSARSTGRRTASSAPRSRRAAPSAHPVRIAIGQLGAVDGDARRALSDALAEALREQSDVVLTDAAHAQLVLRSSVVRWERQPSTDGVEVRCEVSVIVADARGGAIRAMLNGRAGARGGPDAERVAINALRAAVRGALRPLSANGQALARAD